MATRLWGRLQNALNICSLAGLPQPVAERIRAEQVNSLSTLIGVMSVLGQGTAALIVYEFWDTSGRDRLVIAASIVSICYFALIGMSIRWNWPGRLQAERDAEQARRWFSAVCLALGTAWGFLFIDLMRVARNDERSLLYAVIIGLMSAGVLVAPASAAFSFWVPITVSGFVAITFVSDARDLSGTVLLSGYTTLTLFCILYLNRALIRRALGEIDQHEGRETIGLLLRDFEESACDWLWETDEHGRLTHVSNRFAEAARTSADRLLGSQLATLLAKSEAAPPTTQMGNAIRTADLAVLMKSQFAFSNVEISFEAAGSTVWWSLTGKPKYSARQRFEGYRGVGSDVTLARHATERARFLAHYDELTGLANRRLFRDLLDQHCRDGEHASIALLCLDLDRFKAVNDSFGHPMGDALLFSVARRLEHQVRGGDLCARLGGDEFAVVLRDADADIATAMAHRLVEELSRPYIIDGTGIEIGVSIGIAMALPDATTCVALQRNADAALYQAKADGRGVTRLYDGQLKEKESNLRLLRSDLRGAIDRDELRVEYQPIFNLASGQVTAVEALVRWDRPGGTLSAVDFVTLAESSGLVDTLDEWVLARACEEALSFPDRVRVAVNVSPLQLNGNRFLLNLKHVLATTGLAPRRLEIELTETAFLDMSSHTINLLNEVRQLGVRVNLDDFGVGHTSLGHLRHFAFSSLKIDRSFVQDLPVNAAARAIVRALTSMATELGVGTTAEGIETLDQLDLVRAAGCTEAQGYLLARPMRLEAALLVMHAHRPENEASFAELLSCQS